MNLTACFSTGKDNWATPESVFQPLNDEFHFSIDGAADQTNHKCAMWYGSGGVCENGIDAICTRQHSGWLWCNPPYSRKFQPRFIEACAVRRECVMLLPARTDTVAFHTFIWNKLIHQPYPGVEIRFLKGRIRFVGAPQNGSAPFPSMIVIFRHGSLHNDEDYHR